MTDTVANQDENPADKPLPENMPGEQLKKARERLQLSTQEVSEKLNLKHSFVLMMEQDNFKALPGATFVRGYLRAYAKLVKIDGEALVEVYSQFFQEEAAPEERYKPVETIKPQRNFSDPLIKYTTLVVIAGLIALSIMWWQSRDGGDPVSFISNDTVTVETSEGETIIAQMDLSGAEESALTDEILNEELPLADLVAEEGDTTDTADAQTEGGAAGSDEVGAVADAETPAEAEAAEELVIEQLNQERFTIDFSEECWVEITDARGIKVVAKLKQAGEQSLVEGLPPFKLMIGNAGGATVVYQDEVVDLTPYTNRNNIARFTLGD